MIDGLLLEVRADYRVTATTTAVGVGATVVPVENLTPFDDDGGRVDIAGDVYDYTGLDDSTVDADGEGGALLLATGLTVAVDDNAPVSQVVGDSPAVDLYAVVDLGEESDADSAGTVDVPLTTREQRVSWPIGTYDPPLPVFVSDDLSELVGSSGVMPVIDGEIIAPGTIPEVQDLYAIADTKADKAYVDATAATVAQQAANGKNKVWYSTGTPGSTANIAGDIWFQKDVSTQTIIGQWIGGGGSTWVSTQLRNEVIANLDAGKLTVGSAFTNALWVKTNFTLGDATTNGVIQSYNFASSPVGVLIDKNGIVAKGGTLTGTKISTGTGSDDVEITPGSSSVPSAVTFYSNGPYYDSSSPATLSCYDYVVTESGTTYDRVQMVMQGAKFTGSGTRPRVEITTSRARSDGFIASLVRHYAVAHEFWNTNNLTMQITNGQVSLPGSSQLVAGGNIYSGGDLHGNKVFADEYDGAASPTPAKIAIDGHIMRDTSSERFKKNLESLEIDTEAVASLRRLTFQYRDAENYGVARQPGLSAEELDAAGLGVFVFRDKNDSPAGIYYAEFGAVLGVTAMQRIAALETENTALRDQLDDLTARLERLEAAQPQTGA